MDNSTTQWDELNQRQQSYLQTLYQCDQATEMERRELAARNVWDRRPASEWRWQIYGPTMPASPLYRRLNQAGLVDRGTGATWQALETRGLVLTRTLHEPLADVLQIQITSLGRKLVRTATNKQRPPRRATGQLRERQWAALTRLYAAGDGGVLSEEMMYGRGGFNWTRTLLRLRDYQPQPLMEEFQDAQRHTLARMRLTSHGRNYYEQEWARYRELYPNVEAPAPTNI